MGVLKVSSVLIRLTLIAGILSDTPFTDEQDSETLSENPIANFAFTRQQATFLRERLNEFLREE